MASSLRSLDDAPLNAFHRRLALYSCGGPFCDGYILGAIVIALPPLARAIGLTKGEEGAVAAAALVGMFIGGALFGYITDLVGRKLMYTLDLLVFVCASVAQFWVQGAAWLFALRFILGIAVGADYPIACALMVEFTPTRQRGALMSIMMGGWWLGYTTAFLVGFFAVTPDDSSWRWMLASSAVPAAIVAFLRFGMPESPRWLISKGRKQEAEALVRKYIGEGYRPEEGEVTRTDYRRIFRGDYLKRTAFVSVFWTCQIIPLFGIYTFAPDLLNALGVPNPILGSVVISLFFLAGVIPAVVLIDRIGRRPVLNWTFAVTAAALLVLALMPRSSPALITFCFIIFAVFNAGGTVLEWIYPSELFPTEVRATALGFVTAMSRIGAAVGTFLVPIALERLGISALMLIFAGVCGVGWLVSVRYAPETLGVSLAKSSS